MLKGETMKTVLSFSPFVPPEWIAAHGLQPRCELSPPALAVGVSDGSDGVCPMADAQGRMLEARPEVDAVIMTTACDQVRRMAERIEVRTGRKIFLMHLPTTWQTPVSWKIYLAEMKRLGRFLEELGGQEPAKRKLAETMHEYQASRQRLLNAREDLTARQFAQAVVDFYRLGPRFSIPEPEGSPGPLPRLALIGAPLTLEQLAIYDEVEKLGGRVVVDGTGNGERILPARWDNRQLGDDPLPVLAEAYFGSIPDAFRRPNIQLYRWLEEKFRAREVQGIIFHRYIWCDTWHGEARRMKEWCGRPFVELDVTGAGFDERTRGRIQTLCEMLR